jgi:AraC-like DNA-binding protein
MNIRLLEIVNIISVFQLSVFILFLVRKKPYRLSNRLLALFLSVQIVIIINFEIFQFPEAVSKLTPHLFHFGTAFFLLAGPSFFLYIKSLALHNFQLRKNDLLHAFPFIAITLILIFTFYFKSPGEKKFLIETHGIFSPLFWQIFNFGAFIQLMIYFAADLRILKNYGREIRQQFSSIQKINLEWLTYIIYGFILAWLSSVAAHYAYYYHFAVADVLMLFDFSAFFLFFSFIFYKGLSQPEIFSLAEEKQKYISSKLTEKDSANYLEKLKSAMEKSRLYLNPELTLKDLASDLSVPARHLSQVINENFHLNFYDYINCYRIEEAKRILAGDSSGKTVLEILYETGFSSKSSFNTAFKRFTGETPTRFKRRSKT